MYLVIEKAKLIKIVLTEIIIATVCAGVLQLISGDPHWEPIAIIAAVATTVLIMVTIEIFKAAQKLAQPPKPTHLHSVKE